jgi:hypothetical protein
LAQQHFSTFAAESFSHVPLVLQQLIEATFVIIVLGLSVACLSYLGATTGLPLRDGEMIWIDRQLGFDWLAIMIAIDHWPRVLALLDGAYVTFTSQLMGTVLVLILARRRTELDRFIVTFICASAIAEIASVLLLPMSVWVATPILPIYQPLAESRRILS